MSDKARVEQWVGEYSFGNTIRMNDERPFYEFVVTPDGRIKTCYFERNLANALLHVQTEKEAGRVVRIVAITVPAKLVKLGYVLLRDLYAQEDRIEDWESFLLYQRQARKREIVDPIDDDYLPDEVLRRRREYKAEQARLEMPLPKRKRGKVAPKKAERRAPASKPGGLRVKLRGNKPDKNGGYEIQQRRVPLWMAMGTGKDCERLLRMADERDALADGEYL